MFFRDQKLTFFAALVCLLCVMIFSLAVFALLKYPGQKYVYIIFTVISNALFYFGFRNKAIFFDTFIGIFFWLGFWLKFTVRIVFADGIFHEPVGSFDGSGAAFDLALLVTNCGLSGLLAASYIREKFLFNYPAKNEGVTQTGLLKFYQSHRKLVLYGFIVLIMVVSASNLLLGIYQRGAIPRTTLPYGLGGVYKWLLLFGLASFSAVILRTELETNKRVSYWVAILALLESFFSNVSLLSRGMILNASALIYGVFKDMKFSFITVRWKFVVSVFFIFIMLFVISVLSVNYLRSNTSVAELSELSVSDSAVLQEMKNRSFPLFLDRWVGIEGVLAVSSYQKLGWDLWSDAWKEPYSEKKASLYDIEIIKFYTDTDTTKHHYISLPGILAFCYYPGSLLFLFGCMFFLGVFAALIEVSVYKLSANNLILCSLLAQVVAYRYANFGYVPAQSYLLFGTLYLNLFIILFLNLILTYWYKRNSIITPE